MHLNALYPISPLLPVFIKPKSAVVARSLAPQPPLPFQKGANSATRDWERGSHGVEFRYRLRIPAPVLHLSSAYFSTI